ncbi:MAG: hypothetical protein ACRCTZ_16170 [Sarcina sp.]
MHKIGRKTGTTYNLVFELAEFYINAEHQVGVNIEFKELISRTLVSSNADSVHTNEEILLMITDTPNKVGLLYEVEPTKYWHKFDTYEILGVEFKNDNNTVGTALNMLEIVVGNNVCEKNSELIFEYLTCDHIYEPEDMFGIDESEILDIIKTVDVAKIEEEFKKIAEGLTLKESGEYRLRRNFKRILSKDEVCKFIVKELGVEDNKFCMNGMYFSIIV